MQRFSSILFINDPPHRLDALRRALELAEANAARLTVASVSEELPASLAGIEGSIVRHHEEEIRSLLGELSSAGLAIDTRHLTGIPFFEIIRQVSRGGHDLVIKPAEGRGGVSRMLFGSTDLHLFRKCPCPVWILKATRTRRLGRILAPVDPDPDKEHNAELNGLILDLATSLARQEHGELHVLHAWNVPYESALRGGRTYLPQFEVDRLVSEIRETHRQALDDLLAPYQLEGASAKVHFVKGRPGKVIPEVARGEAVDLIVMGTVARTGIPGVIIGNTAEKALINVDCSVLALKPKAFATPVEV